MYNIAVGINKIIILVTYNFSLQKITRLKLCPTHIVNTIFSQSLDKNCKFIKCYLLSKFAAPHVSPDDSVFHTKY